MQKGTMPSKCRGIIFNTKKKDFNMSARAVSMSVLLCLLLLFFIPDISSAFYRDVRCQILKDAVTFCPKKLRAYLTKNYDAVHHGMHYADRNKRSINPQQTAAVYKQMQNNLQNSKLNDYNTMHRFGVLACYISQTISPSKAKASTDLIPQKVKYNGFQKINNVDKSVARLITKYRKRYKGRKEIKVTDFLYNVAVNEIVDHWVSLWLANGKKTGPKRRPGALISHNKIHLEFSARS